MKRHANLTYILFCDSYWMAGLSSLAKISQSQYPNGKMEM